MTEVNDVAASVRQRLLNLAHERGEDFQYVLTHFAIERLIARIVSAGFEDRFILKGAAIFAIWSEEPYRAAKDLDLLGSGDATVEASVWVLTERFISTWLQASHPISHRRFELGSGQQRHAP